ncbi:hypothetical protein MUG87_08710 [Ectobacillus sp. JY-23]|uniref:hypothetical protein n=1 Tax=Ectobacillus sp. JY-23 TaxID=2933872 RepID=UPI001FF3E9B9|nr:hypothetical protein [Ectobacillus sp. JY-23]UOY94163.1 hypothetical protein MUG87_08710 [Ectobacillus sp. JY-23]
MDKQSPKISIKVNGTEANYMEKGSAATLPSAVDNVLPFRGEYEAPISKKRIVPHKKLLLTVGSAVLIGTGFGVTVLQVMGSGQVASKKATSASVATSVPSSGALQTSVQELTPVQAHVMQVAAFSTKEQGNTAVSDWKKQGVPAVLRESGAKFFVFISVADSDVIAKAIGQKKNIKGLYKPWSIEAKAVPKTYEKQTAVIVKANQALNGLLQQSSLCFTTGKVDDATWQKLEKEISAMKKQEKNIEQDELKKLTTYTSLAFDTLKSYREKQEEANLIKLQQLLLDGLLAYETIVTAT